MSTPTTDTSEPKRESARRGRTIEQLLDAAFAVFAEQGYAGTSVEAISERAGFTRGAFYSNFASKEEIFLAVMTRQFGRYVGAIEDRAADVPAELRGRKDAEVFTAVLADLLGAEAGVPKGDFIVREFELHATRAPEIAPVLLELQDRLFAQVIAAIERIVASLGFRLELPVRDFAATMIAVHDQVVLRARLEGVDPDETRTRLAARIAPIVWAFVAPAEG
jgi:AcrR family transcriptional regulator